MAEPITERDHEQVRRLHTEGKSRNANARAIGRSAPAVSKIAGLEGPTFAGDSRVARRGRGPAGRCRRAARAARRRNPLNGALR
ncbi:hypothetical protein [Streptomyces sp. NPDC020489]|uniref:hypothetical protein n=1 Tax=Streptomyces sp. NPDC020489 TaxID=3365077 RepID=UPI0037B49702